MAVPQDFQRLTMEAGAVGVLQPQGQQEQAPQAVMAAQAPHLAFLAAA